MTRSSSRFIIRQNKHNLCNLLQTVKSYVTHEDKNLNLKSYGTNKDKNLNHLYTEYP